MKVVIIIPTYNERENIGALIEALHLQFSSMQHDMNVLVVDDNSPDGTANEVRSLQGQFKKVHLIEGRKSGLGAAYIRGMTHAIENMSANVVFEMDADFSHKPEDVPRLMSEIDRGADFVIGSRYIKGGSIPENWGFIRRLCSFGGNLVARHITDINHVRDCTAGFRAIQSTILRDIDFYLLRVQGYSFQVALLHAAVISGATVIELPVNFIDRTKGESKLGLSDIIEFVENVLRIRLQNSRVFIKFAIVGLSGVVVNLGTFILLIAISVTKYIASPIAIEVSIISNFFLNNYWTFRWQKTKKKIYIKGLKFHLVSLFALSVNYSTFIAISAAYPTLPLWIPQFAGIFPAMIVNYFLNSYWTFKNINV